MKRNSLLVSLPVLAGTLLILGTQSAEAGVTLRQGHKESFYQGSKHSTTTLSKDTVRKEQGHYQNSSAKWDTIHETVHTGVGDKIIETQIEAHSSSFGEVQTVSNEWLDFEERAEAHGYEHETQSYTGWD